MYVMERVIQACEWRAPLSDVGRCDAIIYGVQCLHLDSTTRDFLSISSWWRLKKSTVGACPYYKATYLLVSFKKAQDRDHIPRHQGTKRGVQAWISQRVSVALDASPQLELKISDQAEG